MKKKSAAALACLVLTVLSPVSRIAALPDQKIIYPGDWVYGALAALTGEQRLAFFTGSTLTVSQAKAVLSELDESALSNAGKGLYDRLNALFAGDALIALGLGAFNFGADPRAGPEGYFRTSRTVNWLYDNYRRQPLASLPVTLSWTPYLAAEMDIAAVQRFDALNQDANYGNFFLNHIDFNIPRRAYLCFGIPLPYNSGIQGKIGIGEEYIGRTLLGSVILSDRLKDVTYGSLLFHAPAARYSANIIQLNADKYFYYHQVEARLFKRLTLSLVEGLLVNAPLELRFLNPVMIYHSFAAYSEYGEYRGERDARCASFFGAKFDLNLFRYTRLYGLAALNELQTPGERSAEPDAFKPNSVGFQGGGEWHIPVSQGYWSLRVEGLYTFPFLYVLRNKDWSFYQSESGKSGAVRSWTGTPLGPDTAAAAASAAFHGETWSVSGSYLLAFQGERSGTAIFDTDGYHPFLTGDHGEVSLTAPTGTPMITCALGLAGTWRPRPWASLSLMPGYTVVLNNQHTEGAVNQGFELVLAARLVPEFLRFSKRF
ncbi:MAG: hypothetical protein LBD37_02520 [Treponema sp.]|nr:hypothetical protein [Treponema sp.]